MSFSAIKGQEVQISFLKRAIENSTLAHAYLFAGMDGVGKKLAAATVAKAVNCETGRADSCDICDSCRKIDNKNHPDVFWVAPEGAAGVIKIEAIRNIIERVSFRPYEARYKVCIIEDAHLMKAEAENCLLKTLEEPPQNTVFILTTSNISGIFKTIISRCQIIKFSPLTLDIIEGILINKFGFQKDNARFVARLSGGCMNKKMILDGANFISWKNRIIDEFMKGSFFDEESPFFSDDKKEFRDIIFVLINWYRDLLLYKNGSHESLIVNFDRMRELEYYSERFSYEGIDTKLFDLINAYLAASQNVNPKLIIGALI